MGIDVKRLAPTSETIRRLFLLSGNECAFPGCHHPIIINDGTYVGELCHICAAEEGGERFDSTQTNEDRRQFENLLLMCHDHHVVTDDVSTYPVERMRQIKTEHEARFSRGLDSMISSAAINITDSTVSLGGEGGRAPGAGGGGGGAIGPGAIGGRGGGGGEMREGQFPLDDDVVGMRIHVGRGGPGGSKDGPAQDGEDSVVEVVRRDGTVQELMRAKGGQASDDGYGSAQLDMCMLANSAEVREGLIFALAGGWKTYTINDSLPFLIEFGVLSIVEPVSHPYAVITTSVLDPKGIPVGAATQTCNFRGGSVPLAIKVRVIITEPGRWTVMLRNGERELRRLPFDVMVKL